MAVSQGSGEFLRGISALIQDKKQQRQSEQSMALTSLMFNLKRADAEKQRLTDVLGDAQKQILGLSKDLDAKKVIFGQLGGSQEVLKSLNSGIKTDAFSIVGASMSRIAGTAGEMQKSLDALKQLESQYRSDAATLDEQIGAYSYGAGLAAQRAFKEKGVNGVTVGADGKVDRQEIESLLGDKSDFRENIKKEYGKDIVNWSTFQAGFYKGLAGEEKTFSEQQYKKAVTRKVNQGPGRDYSVGEAVQVSNVKYGGTIDDLEARLVKLLNKTDLIGRPLSTLNDQKYFDEIDALSSKLERVKSERDQFLKDNTKGLIVFPADPDVELRKKAEKFIKDNNKSKAKSPIKSTSKNIEFIMEKLRNEE